MDGDAQPVTSAATMQHAKATRVHPTDAQRRVRDASAAELG
jgi:hypothetical protein